MTTMDAQQAAFSTTRGREKGYAPTEVDSFIARARTAFESHEAEFRAADVRRVAFPLVRRGYSIAAVDAALGRIENAFAAREREAALSDGDVSGWVDQSRQTAQAILDRISRPRRERFQRVSAFRYGYRISEVDLVAEKLTTYLQTGESVTVEQVRGVAFRMQRGGYSEAQVDAVLDATVEVMLAVE